MGALVGEEWAPAGCPDTLGTEMMVESPAPLSDGVAAAAEIAVVSEGWGETSGLRTVTEAFAASVVKG